jgi:hypothetical protein
LEELMFKSGPDDEKFRSVLRWLLDNEQVVKRIDGKVEWKS